MSRNLRVVGAAPRGGTSQETIEAMDQMVLAIFGELGASATASAAASTEAIFKLSTNYMTKPAFDVLSSFYELYFIKSDSLDSRKMSVNEEVDAIFESAVLAMTRGEDITISEDDVKRQDRLALAALQKRLEGLIVLDQGIKQEIVPAIASMQFEDALRQRLEHVHMMWNKVFAQLVTTPGDVSARELALEMAKLTSSVDETGTFYKTVLGEEAPPEVTQGGDQSLAIFF